MPNNTIGKNWLLLRGLSREAAHWGEFTSLLQSRFPAAQVSTLDLPGTGQRYREISPYRIADITEAVRQDAMAQGLLSQPLTVVALSLGGMVSWEWMLRYPNEIAAAALINISLASSSPFYHRLRWQIYPNFCKMLLQKDPYRRELAVLQCVANRREHDSTTATEWTNIQAQRPVSIANVFRQISAAAHYRPRALKPKPPVLLMSGRGDRLVSPACTLAVHSKWRVPLQVHPWGGHDLTYDDGIWVADRLLGWINQLKSESTII